jgi:hypothetical protein
MSNIIAMFKASSKEVIKKYSTFLANCYMKCRKDISWEKSAFGFDKQFWSAFKIDMLGFVLSAIFILYGWYWIYSKNRFITIIYNNFTIPKLVLLILHYSYLLYTFYTYNTLYSPKTPVFSRSDC